MNTAAATVPPAEPVHLIPLRQDAQVIGLVGLAHATSHFSHLLLAPLFPVFMREFGLSFSDVGLLVTLFFVVSGVGQSLSGFWSTALARARCYLLQWLYLRWLRCQQPLRLVTAGWS